MATYPKVNWRTFAYCNDDTTTAFEDMCRELFSEHFLNHGLTHVNHNTPGIEVLPVLEPERSDDQPRQRISFQAKYTYQDSVDYAHFNKSAKMTIKHFKGEIDRVYLFSNKPLNTTSKQYKDIVNLHAKQKIETIPISNGELLDLIKRYPRLVDYYFQLKKPADVSSTGVTLINGITIDQVSGNLIISPTAFPQSTVNNDLLKELISEKLHICRAHAVALEFDALKADLAKLFSYGIDGIEGNEELHYYKLLTCIRDGKDPADHLEKTGVQFRAEAQWLIDFYKNPSELTIHDFEGHSPTAQACAIDRLFTAQYWSNIVQLYDAVREKADPEIHVTLDLYYGLSLLNLQISDKASQIMHDLYDRTKQQRVLLYATFADIRLENSIYQSGRNGNRTRLQTLLKQLDGFKGLKQYKQQELLVAALSLEAMYYLGHSDKEFLEKAIFEYDAYSEATRQHSVIQYIYALCLELNGEKDKAISIYDRLPWKTELGIAERYMTVLFLQHNMDQMKYVYQNLEDRARTIRAKALYLLALDRSGDEIYIKSFREAVTFCRGNLGDLYLLAYYADKREALDIVLPELRNRIADGALQELCFAQKEELLTLFAHLHEAELLETVLKTIEEIGSMNTAVIGEIYRALFEIANKEYTLQSTSLQKNATFEAAERTVDLFLNKGLAKKLFLQVKVLCAGARKLPISSLVYSKQLFQLSPDIEIARNIVACLFDRREKDPTQYAPYLEVLEKSEKPDHCIVVASAHLLLGYEERAEFFAYKALYVLNGTDDYDTYRSYFGLFNYFLNRSKTIPLRSARGSVVITMEEVNPNGEPDRLIICLDSEADFCDAENRSLGIEHLIPTSHEYVKLHGAGITQEMNFRGKKYKITEITPRSHYCIKFIMKKIEENPEKFDGVIWMVSTENMEEAIEQIRELSDNEENAKSRLKTYHFGDSSIGLPVDVIGSCDYDKYVAALKYLLYTPDEALYAGEPVYDDETGQKYIPTLSTLVLFAILKRLDVLEAFRPEMVIPDSYLSFFREEYSKAISAVQASSSMLSFVEGKPVLQEVDKSIPDIWEGIIQFCSGCETTTLSDEERMSLGLYGEVTGEMLFTALKLSSIHLDAFALAKRENATLICDDLFFRKIATSIGIRNLNIVSLIQHLANKECLSDVVMSISKTNYIGLPLFPQNDTQEQEYYQNLMTGEKKQQYYGELIRLFYEAQDRIFRKMIGDDYSEKLNEGIE